GLGTPAFLGKRLFRAGADPAGVAADRLQGQRLTEDDREVSSQPLTAAPLKLTRALGKSPSCQSIRSNHLPRPETCRSRPRSTRFWLSSVSNPSAIPVARWLRRPRSPAKPWRTSGR